ncbi:hypothetical protein ACFL5W_00255 [Thermodesulfobacteriota bacterium]
MVVLEVAVLAAVLVVAVLAVPVVAAANTPNISFLFNPICVSLQKTVTILIMTRLIDRDMSIRGMAAWFALRTMMRTILNEWNGDTEYVRKPKGGNNVKANREDWMPGRRFKFGCNRRLVL